MFYSFVMRAYFALGRFPSPYKPDPKDFDFYFHMWFILLSTLLVFSALVPWVYATSVIRREQVVSKKFVIANIIIYVTTLLLFFSVLVFDPGRYIEWFLD